MNQKKNSILSARSMLVIPLISAMLCPAVAFAQESDTAIVQEDSVGEIVVTAQRRQERLSDVPLSVQAVTGDTLVQTGTDTTAMLTRISPALSFSSTFSATASSLAMRGIQSLSTTGGVQPSVGVVIDNMPVARPFEAVIDLADIDRVEVLSGPQGTLFGKNATAGVLNIVTKRPTRDLEGYLQLSATADEEKTAKGIINIPLSESVAFRLSAFGTDLNPLVKNLGGRDVYDKSAWGVNGKLLLDLSDRTSLLLTGQYYKLQTSANVFIVVDPVSGSLATLQRQLLGPAIGRGATVVNQNTKSFDIGRTTAFTAELNSELSDRVNLVSVTGYRNFRGRSAVDIDGGPVGADFGGNLVPNPLNYPIESITSPRGHFDTSHYWSQELRLNYSDDRLDAILGGYFQNYNEFHYVRTTLRLDGSRVGQAAGQKFISDTINQGDTTDQTIAVFADATYKVTPTLKIFGGLRYTSERVALKNFSRTGSLAPDNGQFNYATQVNSAPTAGVSFDEVSRRDNNISGRAGIQWQPRNNLNFYASYNRGFKGAAVDNSSATIEASAIVRPEIAGAFEIGTKLRLFDGKLAIDAAAYSQKVKDVQLTSLIPGTVSTRLTSAGALKSNGFDVSVTGRPTNGLTLNAAVSYTDAQYSGPFRFTCGPSAIAGVGSCAADNTIALDGTRALGVPKWKIVTSAAYEQEISETLKAGLRLAYRWTGSVQYQLNQDPLSLEPSHGIFDASVDVGAVNDRWNVSLFVNNITNEFYYSYLGTAATAVGRAFAVLPRDFKRYGGVRLNFQF